MWTPASTTTVEVDGMVMFWQISYGLPARVHVTVCPGAGIGGRLHVPAGAGRRGLGAAVVVKAVNQTRDNTNAALSMCRVERRLNVAVPFISVYLVKKGSVLSFFAIQLAFVITAWPLVRIVRQGRKQFSQRPLGYTFVTFAFISVGVGAHVAVAVGVRPA